MRLPVPEKTQKQHNFVLLPETGLGIGDNALPDGIELKEPLLWTVNDGPQKVITLSDGHPEEAAQLSDAGLIEKTLNRCLEKTSATRIIGPDDVEFASSIPEAHRKGEQAYHVKAFRGSKDGKRLSLHSGDEMLSINRLSVFPRQWHLFRFQETTCLFSL